MRPGQAILREGADESFVVLIEDGMAKVTMHLEDGRQALLAIRQTGDLVGEMEALNGPPRLAAVVAGRTSSVRVIKAVDFRAVLAGHPDAAMAVAGVLADRLRWSDLRRADFASVPVRTRLARLLWEIAAAHGRPEPAGTVVDVPLSQAELATFCGAAEVSLQKAMSELRRAGAVDTRYRGFVVRDEAALRAAGLRDPI